MIDYKQTKACGIVKNLVEKVSIHKKDWKMLKAWLKIIVFESQSIWWKRTLLKFTNPSELLAKDIQ